MTILTTGEFDTVAAYDPKEHKLVIVAHNRGDQPEPKSCYLSARLCRRNFSGDTP